MDPAEPASPGPEAVLFGGTFDPLHLGHLEAIRQLRRRTGLPLLLVPAGRPPQRALPVASRRRRRALAEAALEDLADPGVELVTWELDRPGVSYTVATVEWLRASRPGIRLRLALGSDAAARLPSWRRVGRLLGAVRLLVYDRPGHHQEALRAVLELRRLGLPLEAAEVLPLPTPEISASTVRERLRQGLDCSRLLPPSVLRYLQRHPVYGGKGPGPRPGPAG